VQFALRPLSRFLEFASAAGLGLAVAGCAAFGLRPVIGGPSEATIAAGLRETLQIAVERSVTRAARRGGFLDDPHVRIPLPESVENVARGLRAVGFDGTVDDFETAMNRAAERAAREARQPLLDAVANVTFADPYRIWSGPADAATQALREQSEPALRERLAPAIAAAMRANDVQRAYDELRERNRVLALLPDPRVDLERHVTDETLNGLFTLIRDEEGRIRKDPAARTTELLREVYGAP
jgi:uncharacterized protein DUF4197